MTERRITNRVKRKHNKNISDTAMSDFLSMLKYKCDWYKADITEIGQYERSTGVCSKCGYVGKRLSTDIREWTCPICGTHHDRDVCSAEVIEQKAKIIKMSKDATKVA